MADVFQFYRFTKLRVHMPPATSVDYFLGYSNSVFDTAATTSGQVMELPYATRSPNDLSVYQYLDIPRSELLKDSQIPWFKTIPGTPATSFEIQGTIYGNATNATTIACVVEWACEFTQWNLAANSPAFKIPAQYERIPGTDLFRLATSCKAIESGEKEPPSIKSQLDVTSNLTKWTPPTGEELFYGISYGYLLVNL